MEEIQQNGQETKAPQGRAPRWKSYALPFAVLIVLVAVGAYWLATSVFAPRLPVVREGAPFSLTDLDGQTVTLDNTNGKVRLLYFFFANCPDVCPPTTFLLSQVQGRLKEDRLFGDDVMILSVTIDPERDTPEALREFAGKFGADFSGWKFLRGEEKATADLAKDYGIMVTKDSDGNFGHMNLIVLLDREGRIRKWISVNDFIEGGDLEGVVDSIMKDVKSLV